MHLTLTERHGETRPEHFRIIFIPGHLNPRAMPAQGTSLPPVNEEGKYYSAVDPTSSRGRNETQTTPGTASPVTKLFYPLPIIIRVRLIFRLPAGALFRSAFVELQRDAINTGERFTGLIVSCARPARVHSKILDFSKLPSTADEDPATGRPPVYLSRHIVNPNHRSPIIRCNRGRHVNLGGQAPAERARNEANASSWNMEINPNKGDDCSREFFISASQDDTQWIGLFVTALDTPAALGFIARICSRRSVL